MGKSQKFPPGERLRRTKDFDRVFSEGKRRRGPLLSIRYLANGLPHTRLGVALSRAWRSAVRRNRAKRRIREAFRTHKDALPKGIDLVVLPSPNWGEPGPQAIARELARLLRGSRRAQR